MVLEPFASIARPICAAAAMLLCSAATADMYVCTNKAGRTVSGDLPPPDCKDRDIRVLNPDGSLQRVIPAPLTAQQRRERDAAEEARLRQEELDRAQSRRDRALMETYGSVEEIEFARKRSLAGRQMLVDRANERIAQYKKEKKRLDDEAEFYAKREMPAKLKEEFAANKTLTEQQEKTRADAQVEMKHINERFDADRRRYEEIQDMAAKATAAREREAAQMQDAN
jgi:hypothetical protein